MNRDKLRGESIYSVFIRNHSINGDFKGLIDDLDRIQDMGITTIWILPHYSIGEKNRIGTKGSPYSISDYVSINPEYGGLNDFKDLVDKCHDLEIKIIIDIVFNHTSCDSVLLKEHPEWFIKNSQGSLISKVPEWEDVYDLDFSNNDLRNYLITVLHYWADLKVDGFRCNYASIIPLTFWKMAKDTLNSEYKDLIWIAESVSKEFVSFIRHKGFHCSSDSELYNIFDILYDYDVQNILENYIHRADSFEHFVQERRNQEVIYPEDYLKLRFLENYNSNMSAAELVPDKYHHINWKTFSMFEKGIPLINAGEEYRIPHLCDKYSMDKIDFNNKDQEFFLVVKKLLNIEHMHIFINGIYTINALAEDCVHLRYRHNGETLHGIFNFGKKNRIIELEVLTGEYFNITNGNFINIKDERLNLEGAPYIFKSVP